VDEGWLRKVEKQIQLEAYFVTQASGPSEGTPTASGETQVRFTAVNRALDGTPIIATLSDIDSLFSQGYITKATRPDTDPLRYAICPVISDPTKGGIAPDQFLDELTDPFAHTAFDWIKPVVEKMDGGVGCRLQRLRLRGNVRHGVVSVPAL
jgi:hypothetical protein